MLRVAAWIIFSSPWCGRSGFENCRAGLGFFGTAGLYVNFYDEVKMVLPGWDSLESVNAIDSRIRIVTLGFWSVLVVAEIVAFFWKRRATVFNIIALCAFVLAIVGEVAQFKYDARKDILHEQREAKLRTDYNEKIDAIKQHEQGVDPKIDALSAGLLMLNRKIEEADAQGNRSVAALRAEKLVTLQKLAPEIVEEMDYWAKEWDLSDTSIENDRRRVYGDVTSPERRQKLEALEKQRDVLNRSNTIQILPMMKIADLLREELLRDKEHSRRQD